MRSGGDGVEQRMGRVAKQQPGQCPEPDARISD